MASRNARQRRALGLWTAGWLLVFLLVLVLWVGDLRVEWPVLAVPVVWALVAARPRGVRDAPVPELPERR